MIPLAYPLPDVETTRLPAGTAPEGHGAKPVQNYMLPNHDMSLLPQLVPEAPAILHAMATNQGAAALHQPMPPTPLDAAEVARRHEVIYMIAIPMEEGPMPVVDDMTNRMLVRDGLVPTL